MNFRAGSAGHGRRAATVVDITALVDVVFQLLIFFVLTSSYVEQQNSASAKVPVNVPESGLEAQARDFDDLTVTINAAGEIFLDGESITVEQLGIRLARVADTKPGTVLLIRGDKDAFFGRVATVMAIAQASRLKISAVLDGQ